MSIGEELVLTVEISNFPGAHTHISRRNVRTWMQVAIELRHEGLAETPYFSIGLSLGIKVRAALTAAQRQAGQGIFEDLFKGQKLEYSFVDAGMKA